MQELINLIRALYNETVILQSLQLFIIASVGAIISYIVSTRLYPKSQNVVVGEPVIQTALDIAAREFGSQAGVEIRANVFIRESEKAKTISIKFYSTNMVGARDTRIKIERGQGAAGLAWGNESLIIANLTVSEADHGAKWGLTEEQVNLTKDIKAILCVPIFNPNEEDSIIGVLGFDSTADIADFFANEVVQKSASNYAALIGSLMVELDFSIPL